MSGALTANSGSVWRQGLLRALRAPQGPILARLVCQCNRLSCVCIYAFMDLAP
jgi:hypothetical protein